MIILWGLLLFYGDFQKRHKNLKQKYLKYLILPCAIVHFFLDFFPLPLIEKL